jgi:hypothetical protein
VELSSDEAAWPDEPPRSRLCRSLLPWPPCSGATTGGLFTAVAASVGEDGDAAGFFHDGGRRGRDGTSELPVAGRAIDPAPAGALRLRPVVPRRPTEPALAQGRRPWRTGARSARGDAGAGRRGRGGVGWTPGRWRDAGEEQGGGATPGRSRAEARRRGGAGGGRLRRDSIWRGTVARRRKEVGHVLFRTHGTTLSVPDGRPFRRGSRTPLRVIFTVNAVPDDFRVRECG